MARRAPPAFAPGGGTAPARSPSVDESSPIAVSHHDVIGTDDRHHIGDESAFDDRRQRLNRHERWRPPTYPPGPVRTVGHDVAAVLTARTFDRHVGIAGRHSKALRV